MCAWKCIYTHTHTHTLRQFHVETHTKRAHEHEDEQARKDTKIKSMGCRRYTVVSLAELPSCHAELFCPRSSHGFVVIAIAIVIVNVIFVVSYASSLALA